MFLSAIPFRVYWCILHDHGPIPHQDTHGKVEVPSTFQQAYNLSIHISACTQDIKDISTVIRMFSGSKNTMAAMRMLCDVRGSKKSKLIWNNYIAAHIQNINEIPTATPRFSGFRKMIGHLNTVRSTEIGKYKMVAINWKWKNGRQVFRQDINNIPTATLRFSGSWSSMGYMCTLYNVRGREK